MGRLSALALLLLVGLLCFPARAEAMRCDGNLVSEGDRIYELLSLCGQPDYRDDLPGRYLPGVGILSDTERWYYNLGPHRLTRILTVRAGRIDDIETGGYGFDPRVVSGSCSPGAIRRGLNVPELLARCGDPAYSERLVRVLPQSEHRQIPRVVVTDQWTYDLGPDRFVRVLTIEDGMVRAVETASRR